jgi:phosphatidylethanolamine/phosphatidyl-N-methylethanolamine N-methyltransferase
MWIGQNSFLSKFLGNPSATGAVAPATSQLARTVAAAAELASQSYDEAEPGLRIIELGAGTGALSRQLSRLNPVLVEHDETWARLLAEQFPALEVRSECATTTLANLTEPTGVVSSIPLLNNPQAPAIKQLLAERYNDGLLKFCVLYTYGWRDQLADAGFRQARRTGFVARNFPPATVWVYH